MDVEKRCLELLVKSLRPIPQEMNEIDWKVALSNKKERLKKHLSAFANQAGGGFLIFGVNDSGEVVGVDEEESRIVADTIANMARTSMDPQVNIRYVTLNFDGKKLLGIYIEESFEKPVHVKNKSIETAYLRAGGQSRPMSIDEIRRSIVTSRSIRFGEIPATLSLDVQNHWEDYFDFSEVYKRLCPMKFSDVEARNEFLHALKLLVRVNNEYIPSNLAVVTCCKNFKLLKSYERLYTRIVQYSGTTRLHAVRDLSICEGYTLSIDKIFNTVVSMIPHVEQMDGAKMNMIPVIPEIALREIIVNALIHRDFNITNSVVMIEIFDDRIEITNPGSLLPEINVDRLIDHPSRPRNEVISDFMCSMGYCEERGSGIDKAVIATEQMGIPAIIFRNEEDYFSATLFTSKPFAKMTTNEKIDVIYQHACLNTVIQRKTTGRSIRERFGLTRDESSNVYRLINEAVDHGKIKLVNPEDIRKDHYYYPYWM